MEYTAPKDLSKQAQAVWRGVVPRRAKTAERLLLIKTALQALDRADEVSAKIKEQGLTIENPSTGAIRANPLVKLEKELRGQFAAMWSGMSLDWHAVIDGGNLPHFYGATAEADRADYENELVANDAAVKDFLQG
jgi:phage terminase small subunit